MENRPALSRQVHAEIEKAKDKLFEDTKRFSLLFLPARDPISKFTEALIPLARTTAPRQRMPSVLHLQIEDFTESLFDIEARHYGGYTSDINVLNAWLNNLAAEVGLFAKAQVADERLNFHLPPEQRNSIIATTLKARTEHWIPAKQPAEVNKAKPSPSVPVPNIESTANPLRPRERKRLPNTITSKSAAAKLERFLEASPIEKTVFAGNVGTTPRTILRFRSTGKIKRETLRRIAEAMGTTPEELVKPD